MLLLLRSCMGTTRGSRGGRIGMQGGWIWGEIYGIWWRNGLVSAIAESMALWPFGHVNCRFVKLSSVYLISSTSEERSMKGGGGTSFFKTDGYSSISVPTHTRAGRIFRDSSFRTCLSTQTNLSPNHTHQN
jgi:hypothetical protein